MTTTPKQLKAADVVSIGYQGFVGRGWEIQCTGPRRWVERAIKRFMPKAQQAAKQLKAMR